MRFSQQSANPHTMGFKVLFLFAWTLFTSSVVVAQVNETLSEDTDSGRYFPTSDELTVAVSEGFLRGKYEPGNKRPYEAFYAIPYAKPPVGILRFKAPVEPRQYKTNPMDSCCLPKKCIQNDYVTDEIVGSEDCLYLNVYRPRYRSGRLPVLVFLHGGAFKLGSADPDFYGPDFFMDTEEIIVVTINYRLGIFGFLSSGDSSAKGNYGLKDQNMALQWIQRNIEQFGGNRDKVTLWGDSAGAASAHFHVMSQKSNGLFERAIMTGGNALAPWALERYPQKQFRQFAAIAGIRNANTRDTEDLMRDIEKLSASQLQKYSARLYQIHPVTILFRPVIEKAWEDAIVTEDPFLTWAKGNYQQRPVMLTMATNEAAISADFYYDPQMRLRILEDFDNSLADIGEICRNQVGPIKRYYFGNNPTFSNLFNMTLVR